MKTKAYIIRHNEVIALITTELKNGAEVEYSFNSSVEDINVPRQTNLVSAKSGKVSRAAKWDKAFVEYVGIEVNPGEFLIK